MLVNPAVIAFIVFLVVYFLGTEGAKRCYDMRIQAFISTGLYDEAFCDLNRFLPRILFTTYQQHKYRFFVHEGRGERELAERMLELMLRMRNSAKRQAEIDALAFNYYAQAGNRKRAKELLADLKAVKGADRAVIADCQLTYDIVCGHRHDMIDKMESLLPNANDAQKGKLYFLLAKQYANAGNKERARAYRARFDELKAAQRPQAPAEG
ncbi:hypothetical protein [Collinsella intestinalis]|uniref:hypothetical protein n=1 Tax=Collinsella intestinalis TaxID=147207 RepID=UPI00195E78B3|nr:hypothetical protein [Collinsella intestinalis]MBM6942278.1 hypothetical protein [Collinsella intestinalis]